MLGDLAHKFWDFTPACVRSRSIQSRDVAACLVRVSELDLLSLPFGSGQICSYTHSGETLEQLRHGVFPQLQLHFWQLNPRCMRSCRHNCLDMLMPCLRKLGDGRRSSCCGPRAAPTLKIRLSTTLGAIRNEACPSPITGV
jgi:hypothetical protein